MFCKQRYSTSIIYVMKCFVLPWEASYAAEITQNK